jgi:hypothetical protein
LACALEIDSENLYGTIGARQSPDIEGMSPQLFVRLDQVHDQTFYSIILLFEHVFKVLHRFGIAFVKVFH